MMIGGTAPTERGRVVGVGAEGVCPSMRGQQEESDRQHNGARHRELQVQAEVVDACRRTSTLIR